MMSSNGLSILIASGPSHDSRRYLETLAGQVAQQMEPGDELIVDKNDDAPWGHKARNRMMWRARKGNALVFYDDDDMIRGDALYIIRAAVQASPSDWHIFKIVHGATTLWREPTVTAGNVSTQMVCVPHRLAVCCKWGNRYEGDFDFMNALKRNFGDPIFHEEIVAIHNGQRG